MACSPNGRPRWTAVTGNRLPCGPRSARRPGVPVQCGASNLADVLNAWSASSSSCPWCFRLLPGSATELGSLAGCRLACDLAIRSGGWRTSSAFSAGPDRFRGALFRPCRPTGVPPCAIRRSTPACRPGSPRDLCSTRDPDRRVPRALRYLLLFRGREEGWTSESHDRDSVKRLHRVPARRAAQPAHHVRACRC